MGGEKDNGMKSGNAVTEVSTQDQEFLSWDSATPPDRGQKTAEGLAVNRRKTGKLWWVPAIFFVTCFGLSGGCSDAEQTSQIGKGAKKENPKLTKAKSVIAKRADKHCKCLGKLKGMRNAYTKCFDTRFKIDHGLRGMADKYDLTDAEWRKLQNYGIRLKAHFANGGESKCQKEKLKKVPESWVANKKTKRARSAVPAPPRPAPAAKVVNKPSKTSIANKSEEIQPASKDQLDADQSSDTVESPPQGKLATTSAGTDPISADNSDPGQSGDTSQNLPQGKLEASVVNKGIIRPNGGSQSLTNGSVVGGTMKGLRASSTLKPQGSSSYEVTNVSDRNPATAWVEAEADGGVGQSLSFRTAESCAGLVIMNGYQKSNASFTNNGRIKSLRVTVGEAEAGTLKLEDRTGTQHFPLTLPANAEVTLTLTETYPGAKWQDTAVSEIWQVCP